MSDKWDAPAQRTKICVTTSGGVPPLLHHIYHILRGGILDTSEMDGSTISELFRKITPAGGAIFFNLTSTAGGAAWRQ